MKIGLILGFFMSPAGSASIEQPLRRTLVRNFIIGRGEGKFKVLSIKYEEERIGIGCQVSGIRCQVSGIRQQVSGVRYQVSGNRYQVSGIRCQVSPILHQTSTHPTSDVQTSHINLLI